MRSRNKSARRCDRARFRGKSAILHEIAAAVDEDTLGGPQERIVPQSGENLSSLS
jgi:hypothetical protein